MKLELLSRGQPSNRPPLLFVHGMWHGAWCWDEHFLPYFAERGWHAHALSFRGHSASEGNTFGSNVSDYSKDVEAVARTLSRPPIVIGHSLGGYVVQKYLERNEAPAGVLLASVPPSGAWSATMRVMGYSPWNFLKFLLQLRLLPAVQKPHDARWALFSASMPEQEFLRHHARLEDESFLSFLDLLGLNLVNSKKVTAPMLVLGGTDDHIISANNLNRTAKAYGTTPSIFPGTAHDLMLEAAWKDVADRILAWLAEKGL